MMAISLNLPEGYTVRLARAMYEDLWCPDGCPLCDAERAFYDACTDDEWGDYIEAKAAAECDCG